MVGVVLGCIKHVALAPSFYRAASAATLLFTGMNPGGPPLVLIYIMSGRADFCQKKIKNLTIPKRVRDRL